MAITTINAKNNKGTIVKVLVDDENKEHKCPHCKHLVIPNIINYSIPYDELLHLAYKCNLCLRLYVVAYFKSYYSRSYKLYESYPQIKRTTFNKNIVSISPNFINVYNEAEISEENGLFSVCGIAYRKSLEFLVKDYAISLCKEKEVQIRKDPLASVIRNFITDPRIKTTAERASWIGNDEAHYTKLWDNMDVEDLKILIHLVVHWISMEELTKKYEEQMQRKAKQ